MLQVWISLNFIVTPLVCNGYFLFVCTFSEEALRKTETCKTEAKKKKTYFSLHQTSACQEKIMSVGIICPNIAAE